MQISRSLPDTGFLRLEGVLKLIPVGKTTWWNGVKTERFPKSIKLGTRITAWRAEDIRALIAYILSFTTPSCVSYQQIF